MLCCSHVFKLAMFQRGTVGSRQHMEALEHLRSYTSSDSSFSAEAESQSETNSHTRGGSKNRSRFQTYGQTVVPFLKPRAVREKTTDVEWTLEEKRCRMAEMIINQPQRYCFVKLDTKPTQALIVESVEDYGLSEESLREYQQELYQAQGAIPAAEVDRLIEASQRQFLAKASQTVEIHATGGQEAAPDECGRSVVPWQAKAADNPIWNRTSKNEAAEGNAMQQRVVQGASRKRGPKTDIETHTKVAAIIHAYSDQWMTEENLVAICGTLDREGVPVPKTWP